jgi:hypothetical protein
MSFTSKQDGTTTDLACNVIFSIDQMGDEEENMHEHVTIDENLFVG